MQTGVAQILQIHPSVQKVNLLSTKFTLAGDNGYETKHTVHAKSEGNLWTPTPTLYSIHVQYTIRALTP